MDAYIEAFRDDPPDWPQAKEDKMRITFAEDGLARIRFTRPHAPLTVIQFGDEREEIGAFPTLPIIRITNGG